MGMELAKIAWLPIGVALRAVGGITSGAARGAVHGSTSQASGLVLSEVDDIFPYLQHHVQNIVGGGLGEIKTARLLDSFQEFIKELLGKDGFKKAFADSGNFAGLTKAISGLTLKGGAVVGAYGALALGAIVLGKKLFFSENEQTDLASRGWSTDFIKSEGFHKFRMAMGGLLAGGGILSIAAPSIGVPLAVIGGSGAFVSKIYRDLIAGLNPINHPDFGSWWNRWFFRLFNSYYKTNGY